MTNDQENPAASLRAGRNVRDTAHNLRRHLERSTHLAAELMLLLASDTTPAGEELASAARAARDALLGHRDAIAVAIRGRRRTVPGRLPHE